MASGGAWEGAAQGIGNATNAAMNMSRLQDESQHMRAVEGIQSRQLALQEEQQPGKLQAQTLQNQGQAVNLQAAQADLAEKQRKEKFRQEPWDAGTDPLIDKMAGGDDAMKQQINQRASKYPKTNEGRANFLMETMSDLKFSSELVTYRDSMIVGDLQKQIKVINDPEADPKKKLEAQQKFEQLQKQHSSFITAQQDIAKRQETSKVITKQLDEIKKSPEWKGVSPQLRMALELSAKMGDEKQFSDVLKAGSSADMRLQGLLEGARIRSNATVEAADKRAGATVEAAGKNAEAKVETANIKAGSKKGGVAGILGPKTGSGPSLKPDGKGGFVYE